MSDSLTVFGTDYTGVTGIKAKGTGNGMLTYIRPTGTKSISANGTGIDVAAYSLVDVAVAGGGSGSPYYVRAVVVPEQTVTLDGDKKGVLSDVTIGLSLNGFYIVTFNGVEYYVTCHALFDWYLCIGDVNVQIKGQSEANSMTPFHIVSTQDMTKLSLTLWCKSNSASTVSVKVEELFFTDEITVAENIVPQQTVTLDSNRMASLTSIGNITPGYHYAVTFDGVEYVCTAALLWNDSEPALGDSYIPNVSRADYLYPFYIGETANSIDVMGITANTSHTVKVDRIELPEGGGITIDPLTVTSNGTYTAQTNHAYTPVTVNVPSSGGTDFVVTVSYNSSTGMWEPDCTYAEVSAAMGSGKSLSAKITSGVNGAADAEWNSNSNTMLYAVFATNSVAWYQYVYSLTAQGINLVYQGTANRYTLTVNASGRWEAAQFNAYGFDVVNVPDGTAGTPTATKGNVSNHSISVTPSVTNTDGWITGGTKTGTAVTVSASELVSGNKAITENGTNIDVTNYATVSVNVPSGGTSMNVQTAQSTTRVANTAYTKTASLTCAVSGTYDVYWDCFRSTTAGTSGSQLYIGGTASGSANTTFSNHAQNNHRTGVHINANQEVAVYVRSRATNYYAYCGQLTIVQTA